jgi:hypothetical protein
MENDFSSTSYMRNLVQRANVENFEEEDERRREEIRESRRCHNQAQAEGQRGKCPPEPNPQLADLVELDSFDLENTCDSVSLNDQMGVTILDLKYESKAIIQTLGCVLQTLVESNAGTPPDTSTPSKFLAERAPSISIQDYLYRIARYSCTSQEVFILALIYIDKFIRESGVLLHILNVHRILITATMLAAKFFDDQYYNNAYFARVGGIPRDEINQLEIEFLFGTRFSLRVTPETFDKYQAELTNHAVRQCSHCNEVLLNVHASASSIFSAYSQRLHPLQSPRKENQQSQSNGLSVSNQNQKQKQPVSRSSALSSSAIRQQGVQGIQVNNSAPVSELTIKIPLNKEETSAPGFIQPQPSSDNGNNLARLTSHAGNSFHTSETTSISGSGCYGGISNPNNNTVELPMGEGLRRNMNSSGTLVDQYGSGNRNEKDAFVRCDSYISDFTNANTNTSSDYGVEQMQVQMQMHLHMQQQGGSQQQTGLGVGAGLCSNSNSSATATANNNPRCCHKFNYQYSSCSNGDSTSSSLTSFTPSPSSMSSWSPPSAYDDTPVTRPYSNASNRSDPSSLRYPDLSCLNVKTGNLGNMNMNMNMNMNRVGQMGQLGQGQQLPQQFNGMGPQHYMPNTSYSFPPNNQEQPQQNRQWW